MLISVIVLPVSASSLGWVSSIDEVKAGIPVEFAYLMYDKGVGTVDPKDILTALFGIKKNEICVREEDDIFADQPHYAGRYIFRTYYFDFDSGSSDIADADIIMYSKITSDINRNDTEYCTFSGGSGGGSTEISLTINKTGISHLSDDLKSFVSNISTPKKLYDYCGAEVSSNYYNYTTHEKYFEEIGCYHFAYRNHLNEAIPNTYDGYFQWTDFYGTYYSDHYLNYFGDSVAFLTPSCAIITRTFVDEPSPPRNDPVYGIPQFSGIIDYGMKLNYTDSDTLDLIDRPVNNIEIKLRYSIFCDEHLGTFAPQTGIATALLAVAALVSGAYVVKKRRR